MLRVVRNVLNRNTSTHPLHVHTLTYIPSHAHPHMHTLTCTPSHAHPHLYTLTHLYIHTLTYTPSHTHPYTPSPHTLYPHIHTLTQRDLERIEAPVYSVKAHEQIVNSIDGIGGLGVGGGAPELVTGSRDGEITLSVDFKIVQ